MIGIKLDLISLDSVTNLDHSRALQSPSSHRKDYGAVCDDRAQERHWCQDAH